MPSEREVPGSVRRVQGLRSSGAAGVHEDRRTRRIRDRSASERAAVDDQYDDDDEDPV